MGTYTYYGNFKILQPLKQIRCILYCVYTPSAYISVNTMSSVFNLSPLQHCIKIFSTFFKDALRRREQYEVMRVMVVLAARTENYFHPSGVEGQSDGLVCRLQPFMLHHFM